MSGKRLRFEPSLQINGLLVTKSLRSHGLSNFGGECPSRLRLCTGSGCSHPSCLRLIPVLIPVESMTISCEFMQKKIRTSHLNEVLRRVLMNQRGSMRVTWIDGSLVHQYQPMLLLPQDRTQGTVDAALTDWYCSVQAAHTCLGQKD
eukprot:gnl/TRDRNA2_/TRDRNA2_66337_c0_seq1.p2 gnl/TRDRNA2_/TRDRNA2_66337_c0~~gnl/TRDRNA2_/TRDRNA2_66337_c0_seq1.p2  ORF type:complete len:147 (-),score=13.46 gnl/TRDRNA2_/TRDRNA2_66337_c0_seq1:173-613(-)